MAAASHACRRHSRAWVGHVFVWMFLKEACFICRAHSLRCTVAEKKMSESMYVEVTEGTVAPCFQRQHGRTPCVFHRCDVERSFRACR